MSRAILSRNLARNRVLPFAGAAPSYGLGLQGGDSPPLRADALSRAERGGKSGTPEAIFKAPEGSRFNRNGKREPRYSSQRLPPGSRFHD